MLLAFVTASLYLMAGQTVGLRTLTQAAPPPTAKAKLNAESLQNALRNLTGTRGRPVSYKNVQAALHVAYASGGMLAPNDPSVIRKLANDSSVLIAWQKSSAAITMAFQAKKSSMNFNVSDPGFAPGTVNPFLEGDFAGAYPKTESVAGSFLELAAGKGKNTPPLKDIVANISSNLEVRRVVCTGYGDGGALAQLCGIWAAVTYPDVHVRVIAFGAPVVGNVQFAFAFQQLVDLSYLWSLSTHLETTNATIGGRGPAEPIYLLNDDDVKKNKTLVPNSFDAYVAAVLEYSRVTSGDDSLVKGELDNNSGGVKGFFDDISSIVGAVTGNLDRFGDILDAIKSFAYKGDEESSNKQANIDVAMKAKKAAKGCPPVLCKVRPAVDAACQSYQNGTGTIGKGSVTVGPVEATATQVAVDWNSAIQTATFAFRGTASQAGWLQDFKVTLSSANTNPALDQFFPDVKIHYGFLESLLSVTQKADNPKENITAVLDRLAGGTANPTRIIITGHSLGAAIAAVAGPWASLAWPAADVRVVTFGSPFPGNAQFAEIYKLLAGRQNRMVHMLDVVPALPPLNNFVPVESGRWGSDNDTIILEERPEMKFDDLNWDDHSCRKYQFNTYTTRFVTAPTDLGRELASGGST